MDQPNMNGPGGVPPGMGPRHGFPPPPPWGGPGGNFPPLQRKAFGCSGCGLAVLLGALGISVMLNFALSLNAATMVGGDANLIEKTYSGDMFAENKILLISIEGAIMPGSGTFTKTDPVADVRAQLKLLERDPSIKAVMVRVDSPGGAVTASDDIYNMLLKVKKTTPVYVSMGSLAASGGYYVSAAANKIFAEPTTITGSIGVLIQYFNFSELLADWKIHDQSYASGNNKQILSMTKPASDSQRVLVQSLVDAMYERFLDVVAEGRKPAGLTKEELRVFADGRIMLADEAKRRKLVDQIGYLDDAIDALAQDNNIGKFRVVYYEKLSPFGGLFGAQAPSGLNIHVDPRLLTELGTPQFMAIMKP